MTPPRTRRDAVVDTLHGTPVPDPYRWLEAGDDPEVQHWVTEQNRVTRSALDAIPEREVWHERLVALMGLPVVQGVQVRGERLFLLEREAGAQQARLVVRPLPDPLSDVMVLADPASGSADAAAAVDWFMASPDGSLVVFGVSEGGTENSVLRVARSVEGSLLEDEIPNCRACSVQWEPDSSGFVYTRYPEGDEYHRTVHEHVLGQPWADDPVVWKAFPTPQTWPEVRLSPDGRFLLVEAIVGWGRTDLHVLDRHNGEWRDVLAGVEAQSDFTFADDSTLIGSTTLDAPRRRVVVVDLLGEDVGPESWRTVVPEGEAVLGTPAPVPGGFYLGSTLVAVDRLEFVADDGSIRPIDGLGVCTLAQVSVDRHTGAAVAVVTGFDEPAAVWLLDAPSATATRHYPEVDREVVPDLEVSQVEYASPDGTAVPMFLIHRAGTTPGDETPTILNGYGGFAITEGPVWSAMIAAWCASGGLYALAGLRGGSEHGEAWHLAGRRDRKQNVFDDFHAAADWLVSTGRTSRDRLAIAGGSNGGLLMGAAVTQRPDLCRAVWCAVPLLDMIRFPEFLIARLWTDEYGDPDVADEFEWLLAYSPYHHVAEGVRYPAILLTTAEGDTRVDPLHARKMAAILQWATDGVDEARPVLLHQESRAGHGVGKPVGKQADTQADVLAFFSWQLA